LLNIIKRIFFNVYEEIIAIVIIYYLYSPQWIYIQDIIEVVIIINSIFTAVLYNLVMKILGQVEFFSQGVLNPRTESQHSTFTTLLSLLIVFLPNLKTPFPYS